jgi:hypothetical protein
VRRIDRFGGFVPLRLLGIDVDIEPVSYQLSLPSANMKPLTILCKYRSIVLSSLLEPLVGVGLVGEQSLPLRVCCIED